MTLPLFPFVPRSIDSLWQAVKRTIFDWTKPPSHESVLNVAMDLIRPKSELVLENAFLRQQLIVLQRQKKRPALTGRDRVMMVLLASKLRRWKEALIVVQPDTLMCWPLPSEGSNAAIPAHMYLRTVQVLPGSQCRTCCGRACVLRDY